MRMRFVLLASLSVMTIHAIEPYGIPDPLVMENGKPVREAAQWPARRAETLALFESGVYGKSPALPPWEQCQAETLFDKEAFAGKGRLREVIIHFPPSGTPPLHLLIAYPKTGKPVPSFVGLNFMGNHAAIADSQVRLSPAWIPSRGVGVVDNRATEAARGTDAASWPFALAIERGYAMATLYHGDIDPDRPDWKEGVHAAFFAAGQMEPGAGEWAGLAAWAWALRIAGSYLMAQPEFDPRRVCLMGHSRNGKTALWAGAQDERFALVVSNQSGCGGAALSRAGRGEQLADINTRFPHWFTSRFHAYNGKEAELPVDQHQLLALIAPRPVLVCSAEEDLWADPQGEFEACVAASPVYRLLGTDGFGATALPPLGELVRTTIGYHIRPGKHAVTAEDWKVFLDFADARLLK
ncbi:MAG: hypothetical protein DVB23_000938 [Verrucomicrobia bacterium]|nr:MAG: hypothetical protein DVB23_000938 [Verrucomicrobiota bacterium]